MTSSNVLTAEEISNRLYPTAPAISPDGSTVAFVVQPMGRDGEHDKSAIWVSRNGAAAMQFTSGLTADTSPVFSPDSTKLAFISDRHERGKHRVYVMPLGGGEAVRTGTVEGSLDNLQWSPDGSLLGVVVTDPETEAEKKAKEDRNDPILEDQNLKYGRLWVINTETGASRQLTHGKRHVLDYGFSLDGSRIAVVTSARTDVEAEFQRCELGVISTSGGRTVKVAETLGMPSYLMFIETREGERIAARFNGFFDDPVDSIWLFPTEPGEGLELLTDDHGNVEAIYPIPGKPAAIGLRMVETVHGNAIVVDANTGERTYALPENWVNHGT
ncbi:MAG: LpqB family beta-propeller domain-containing protein, partial [Chloroflexota bacterium]|nr:LpqB family beta-propeller domain-containing protein [Chloroflexota bacterium]